MKAIIFLFLLTSITTQAKDIEYVSYIDYFIKTSKKDGKRYRQRKCSNVNIIKLGEYSFKKQINYSVAFSKYTYSNDGKTLVIEDVTKDQYGEDKTFAYYKYEFVEDNTLLETRKLMSICQDRETGEYSFNESTRERVRKMENGLRKVISTTIDGETYEGDDWIRGYNSIDSEGKMSVEFYKKIANLEKLGENTISDETFCVVTEISEEEYQKLR